MNKNDLELAETLATFYDDPLGYVMYVFPWNTDESIQMVPLPQKYRGRFPGCEWGPDEWACDFLEELGAEIRKRKFDGKHAVPPIKFATVSGHGIGKTTLVAMLVKFIMDTRPDCRGTVTAGTDVQLRTKTWAEVGKWHRISLTAHLFDYSTGRGSMALRAKENPGGWFCTAQTCREENSESFAGQHAANSTSFYIMDEASAVPDTIFEVRDNGLTDGEPMVFDFGNGTRNQGAFYRNTVGDMSHRYIVRHIDSRDVAITNKNDIQQKLEDHGEDSDYFKVRVRGMFPSTSSVQFIGNAIVDEACKRELYEDRSSRVVLGVDVARYGDDETVIYARKGMDARSWGPWRFAGLDGTQIAGRVIDLVHMFNDMRCPVAAIFVDGTGVGASVVDSLRYLGYKPVDVSAGVRATKNLQYRLKSDEMWGDMKEAIMNGLCLPSRNSTDGKELYNQLTQREYGYTLIGNRIQLESKKDMKSRGIGSPDLADALALTFAQAVAPQMEHVNKFNGRLKTSALTHDPYKDL